MALRLIPQEKKFFDFLKRSIENNLLGVIALRDLLHNYDDFVARAQVVRDREHDGDQITHEIMNALSKTFITPFDREDIYALAASLDDILDYAEEVADTLVLYKIERPTEHLRQMTDVLVAAVAELQLAIEKLDKLKNIAPHWIEVNTLENEGDRLNRKAISQLFETESNPIEIIKWKDIYGLVESSIDKCEDAANIIENIVIKHG